MFDGFEIDMLSLSDADCILVTQWSPFDGYPFRVLVDGGSRSHAKLIKEFLAERDATHVYAVVCTHPHKDHAGGLVELIKTMSVTCTTAWMHDIRNHLSVEALRRACSGNSPQADGVKETLETTRELASAFAVQHVTPQEPFAGAAISALPALTVLGPSLPRYNSILKEFTNESADFPSLAPFLPIAADQKPVLGSSPGFIQALFNTRPLGYSEALLGTSPWGRTSVPSRILPPPAIGLPLTSPSSLSVLAGVLSGSSVKENPSTQPFNNTSVILGAIFLGYRYLLTADAGSDALSSIPAEWKALHWMQIPHHGSDGNLSQELIERFCPRFANISACGDSSHPSRAIVSGLVKVGAQVFSTHLANPGHLRHVQGNVPYRRNYFPAVPMRGTGSPEPLTRLSSLLGRPPGLSENS